MLHSMLDTIKKIQEALLQQRPLVYCRLVETRGSTPQKAGAMMLVYENGDQDGTLGGGCVEAEVKRKAISVLQDGQGQVTTFQLDHDYGWDDGLICGGRMTILMQPLVGSQLASYFETLVQLATSGDGFTEAIVFDAKSGAQVPASYLFDAAGSLLQASGQHDQGVDIVRRGLRSIATRPRPYAEQGIALPTTSHAVPTIDCGWWTHWQGGGGLSGGSGF